MRIRLIGAFLGIAFLVFALQDLPLLSYLRDNQRDMLTLQAQRDAWALAGEVEESLELRELTDLASRIRQARRDTGARVDVLDTGGTVIGSTRTTELGYNYRNRPEVAAALRGRASSYVRDVNDQPMLYVSVPIRHGEEVLGVVRLGYVESTFEDEATARLWIFYVTGALTLLIIVGAAFVLSSAYTRRLRVVHAATEELAAGELTTRVDELPGGADELRGLERAFNNMAARLQGLVEAQRTFASDASHQLRTPLTALRLRLENAAVAAEQDPTTASTALEAASLDVQRLQVLVDGLLALARLEGRTTPVQEIDVDPVMRERLLLWQPLADEREVRLTADVPADLRVLAAPGALDQVLDSYLDNALEAAPRGSTIHITARVTDAHVEFHVVDGGPGMEAPARARAFDRFWRQRVDGTGTGLGLAIAARLAQVSGGAVRLDANVPHGIDAVLQLQRVHSGR